MSDETILSIRGLVVKAPTGAILVDGVDVDLAQGEVLGLIGESGAGKSTIGLAAMGYGRGGCRITDGRIVVGTTSLMDGTRATREGVRGAKIAYVAQSAAASFNPAKRIGQQIMEGPLYHGLMNRSEAESWMLELLTALQLPDPSTFAQRYPHQVSGGQLQRAMVAMAMACRPDILVLDEPTTALDVTTQIEVLALLRELIQRYNTAALYITHDLAVVAQIADRIMVLRHGKMVELGTAAEVLEAPKQDYTRRLVAEREASIVGDRSSHQAGDLLLEVKNAVAFYGKKQVLTDVSCQIRRGETLAVVGESGSGKSTLARVIAGLPPHGTGTIDLEGQRLATDYRKRSKKQLRRIQLVYQLPDVALNPRQTVGEIIGRPMSFYFGMKDKEQRVEVARLLELIGLPAEFTERLPGALSGGQKQRVCIARALAAKPDLIICDEVTSALDPLVAEEILKLLRKLQDELKVSYLFITHDLGVVKRLADRTMVMQHGRVIEEGATSEIFRPPHAPYTEQLIASVPELRRDWLDDVLKSRGQPAA
ncbi:ABC transporter ATP-binding protein (plasmid) [Rhizobium grahamii]|uniref:ABC transporter ATP-binding protein n=1 Tax=Rhizobium grahamii TaxID=1120045 RepID=A0A5Q0CEQ3_9HYPH|nr:MULTISPECIES: ABC transporter ATP-binding protein [Rhizobium]QFY62600.1 ABC transporter ATP-binding protein [Rhizobium grahamii]QRM52660.1 ABC transporter ATP-binding protein [Rhizobium sp. BG6]